MYLNLNEAITLNNSTSTKALTLVPTKTGFRTRLGAELWKAIGEPEMVEVLQLKKDVVILPARINANGIKVGKGRYFYDTELAKSMAKLAGIDFDTMDANSKNKSVQVGTFEIQPVDETINAAVIAFNK